MKYVIGKTLKQARKKAGYSVEEVAHLLHENGINISIKSIYGWENSFCSPSVDKFLILCEIYGIDDILETFKDSGDE